MSSTTPNDATAAKPANAAGAPANKRQRMDNASQASPVVILDSLAANTTEAEIRDSLAHFGAILDVVVLPTYASASVHFDSEAASQLVMDAATAATLRVAGAFVAARYSHQKEIVRRGLLESNQPSPVLVFNLTELYYPIDADILKKVCEPHGQVLRVVVMPPKAGPRVVDGRQALIEMSSEEEACQVKLHLNGADIYPGSCRIKVSYCKQTSLTVHVQTDMQRDFVNPLAGKSASLLTPPDRLAGQMPPAQQGYDAPVPDGGEWFGGVGDASREGGDAVSAEGGMKQPLRHPYAAPSYGGRPAYNDAWGPMGGHPAAGYHDGYSAANNGQEGMSCKVLLVHNAMTEHMNCDKLFNLICPYGNVARIKFLRNKPNTAMVEMSDGDSADRVAQYLHECPMFGKRLIIFSCQAGLVTSVVPNSDGDVLADGTSVFKDFSSSRENRFLNQKKAHKNRLAFPNTTLHWWNMPCDCTEETLLRMFTENGTDAPVKVNMFMRSDRTTFSTGLAIFKTPAAAAEALARVNHAIVPADVANSKDHKGEQLLIKMNFSSAGPQAEHADRLHARHAPAHFMGVAPLRVVPPQRLAEARAEGGRGAPRGRGMPRGGGFRGGARGGFRGGARGGAGMIRARPF